MPSWQPPPIASALGESSCITDVDRVIATPPTAESTTASLPRDLVSELDAAARASFAQAAAPGAIVGVRTPQGTWTEAYGTADPAAGTAMAPRMHTRIGSITQTFTGTLILQLAERHELTLDDLIEDYEPDIPHGDRISLRMLAIEPGAEFDDSDTNTILLGKVIEQVAGQPIASVLAQQILEPLGMESSSWRGDAGELISNIDDLLVYDRALATGQGLLQPATQRERLVSIPNPGGHGIALRCIDGWVGHSGARPGYNTALYYDTSSDTSVVVQTNSDSASGDCPESPTLTDDPRDTLCSSPATRIFVALTTALGHTFTPLPQR